MSAALTSGTYGRSTGFSGTLLRIAGLFARPAPATAHSNRGERLRVRIREANEVRDLARSVEVHSPSFAADLYAAASRHEGLKD